VGGEGGGSLLKSRPWLRISRQITGPPTVLTYIYPQLYPPGEI